MISHNLYGQIVPALAVQNYNPKNFKLDGTFYRFDRNGKDNGWAIGYESTTRNGKPFGVVVYGDWKTNEKHQFQTNFEYNEKDKIEISRFFVQKKEEVNFKLKILVEVAARNALETYSKAKINEPHAYLTKKKIDSITGLKVEDIFGQGKKLTLPVTHIYGHLRGLQQIDQDGNKRFLPGQENKGNFIRIPEAMDLRYVDELYICEGFATGASIHLATKKFVICAMNASNIAAVCWKIKQFKPEIDITIVGDDDRFGSTNVGRAKATKAAEETASKLVFPKFQPGDNESTDMNDIHVKHGLPEVLRQLSLFEEVAVHQPLPTILAAQFLKSKNMNYHGENRLVAWRKEFYQFTGKFYKKLIESDLFNDILLFLQKHPIAWTKSKPSLARDVIGLVEAKTNVKSENPLPFWISDVTLLVKDVITLNNGIIDLSNVKNINEVQLQPHSSDLLQTTCLDFDFDPKGKCEKWKKFLDDMLPDKETQRSLQEWFGYNLVFDTSFQKFALLYGQGANGKTVCCIVLKALIGEKNISAVNLEAFDPKRTFNIAATMGKLANIVEELNSNSKAEEGELKKFVSGGVITVERKGKDPFEMVPTARLTFATNTLPRFSDSSNALWRRLLLYPFKKQILDSSKQDRRLVDPQFWIDSGELSGIFNWALEGLLHLRKTGEFTVSSEMKQALGGFESESNPTRSFLLESCTCSKGSELNANTLYEKYHRAMLKSGYQPLGTMAFTKEVKLAFPDVEKSEHTKTIQGERVRVWYNLVLKDGVGGFV